MKFKMRQMEVFRAVILGGSITNAAKMLYVSQPAVSRMIVHTEESLGIELFRRTRGRLVPTAEALQLFEEVKAVYTAAARADRFAENLAAGPSGTLGLCVSPCLARSMVPGAIQTFLTEFPGTNVNIYSCLLGDMPLELLSKRADLAISVLPLNHPNLVSTAFASGRMVCAMPRGHELESRSFVDLADIARFPLVVHSRGIAFGEMINAAFEEANLVYRVRSTVLETDVACSLVQAGVGLAIVDEFTVGGSGWPGITTRPLSRCVGLAPSVTHSSFEEQTPIARRFVAILSQGRGAGMGAEPGQLGGVRVS